MGVILFQYTGTVILFGLLLGLFNIYSGTREDALNHGCSRLWSEMRGVTYPFLGLFGIILFVLIILNNESLGIFWTLALIFTLAAIECIILFVLPKRKPFCADRSHTFWY